MDRDPDAPVEAVPDHLEIIARKDPIGGVVGRVRSPHPSILKPEKGGVPLKIAMFLWGDPETVDRFRVLEETEGWAMRLNHIDGIPLPRTKSCTDQFAIYEQLKDQLVARLSSGELVGTGYHDEGTLSRKRSKIPADRWPDFEFNCERSFVKTQGIVIAGILVSEASNQRTGSKSDARPISEKDLLNWYVRRCNALRAAGERSSQERDFMDAKEKFADRVTRARVLALREEHAPDSWKRRGRRPQG